MFANGLDYEWLHPPCPGQVDADEIVLNVLSTHKVGNFAEISIVDMNKQLLIVIVSGSFI